MYSRNPSIGNWNLKDIFMKTTPVEDSKIIRLYRAHSQTHMTEYNRQNESNSNASNADRKEKMTELLPSHRA